MNGLRHLGKALVYSLRGLRLALRHETAFRQEMVGLLVLVPAAIALGRTALETAVLIASLLLVAIVELLNSAIEAAVDRVGPERHPLSARAKDLGSAAVFLAVVSALVVWVLVAAWPRLG
jgi:diacylglycerol kinase (ATP)